MITWQPLRGEIGLLYSPIGLHLIDDLTAREPIGTVSAHLDQKDDSGNWQATDIAFRTSLSGFICYPGLGRCRAVRGTPRRFRARIEAALYRPAYLAQSDGIEFDEVLYNDTNPPPDIAKFEPVQLLPSVNYPFPAHVPVIRGRVLDDARVPVENVDVFDDSRQSVLTDERGEFSLPLRFVRNGVTVAIDAVEHRTDRTGNIGVVLPDDLGKSHEIIISDSH